MEYWKQTGFCLFIILIAVLLMPTLVFAEETIDSADTAGNETVVFDERGDQMSYGQRVAQLNKQIEEGKIRQQTAGKTGAKAEQKVPTLVLCRTNEQDADFSPWNPSYVVAGPYQCYTLCFDSLEAAENAVAELCRLEWIRYAELDGEVTASATASHEFFSTGATMMNFSPYLDYTEEWGSSSAVVAVVDSGVYPHSMLSGRMLESGYDYVDDDDDATNDPFGHGTGVAGILADCTDGAPVYIYPIRVLSATGGGKISNLVSGIREAIGKGVAVINLSLETEKIYESMDDAIFDAMDSGITVVVAAGNKNIDTADVSPAHIDASGVVVVGAVTSDGVKASYSNYGVSVDLYAYGSNIICCSNTGGYQSQTGTSMAAPHISGLAALLKLLHHDLTPAEIEYRICRSLKEDTGLPIPDLLQIIPADIGFSLMNLSLNLEQSISLSTMAFPITAEELISYTSSDNTVVSVTDGVLTPVSIGEATVTASCFGFEDTSFTVNVENVEDSVLFQVPNGVHTLEDEAFRGSALLTEILLPEGILTLGDHILEDCPQLTMLELPSSIVSIGENSFSGAVLLCMYGSVAADYAAEHNLPYILNP